MIPFRLIFFICFAINFATLAQNQSPEINLSKIDYAQIETAYNLKLNKLRQEQNCGTLGVDPILKFAANDQSVYMLSINKLSHTQKTKGKENPHDRVVFYKGTHDQVGENCIKIYLKKPMTSKYNKNPTTANTYEEAAEELFQGWKHSPGHYKNMITPGYDVAGLGFAFSLDSSVLYCAQVFSAYPYVPPAGLESPLNSFNVKPNNKKNCDCFNTKDASKAIMAIQLIMGTDSIYLKSEDLQAIKLFFNKPTDAIYFDVVLRQQFLCANNNLLHGSEIYDGSMLPPVYFKDLYKRNLAQGDKNFFGALCAVPEKFNGYNYEINYGMIKENAACSYTWPVPVPGENLKVLQLLPKWLELKNEKIPEDVFAGVLSFNIPFERGKTKLNEKQQQLLNRKLLIYKPFIKSASIKTFSSIDGPTEINLKLQEERANEIKNEIQKVTGTLPATETESKENWEEFYKQIETGKFSYLKLFTKEQIKNVLRDKSTLDSIDYLLKKTRVAQLNIEIETVINENSDPYQVLGAYKKAVLAGDSLKSFTYQKKLLQSVFSRQLTNADVTQINLPFEKKFLPHWTNFIALATFDPELIYTHEIREMALKVLKIDSTYKPLQFNLCIMALKFLGDYGDTIIPISVLERKMKDSYLMKEKGDSLLVTKMLLNYNIISAYHHWLRHEYDKIDKPLLYIKKYFESGIVTEAEAIKLGLLFNFYGRCSWTTTTLLPFIKKDTKNEDLEFLFIKTEAGQNHTSLPDVEWQANLKKAVNMNKRRYYDWIDKECFQLMRMPEVKKEFCKISAESIKK